MTSDIDEVLRDLDKAQRHCKRAIYDSLEVGITYHLELIMQFQDDYRNVMITPVVPDYIELTQDLSGISTYLGATRDFAREKYWIDCSEIYERVKDIYARLFSSREELNKALSENHVSTQRYRKVLGVAVIAIIVAIIGISFNFFPLEQAVDASNSSLNPEVELSNPSH